MHLLLPILVLLLSSMSLHASDGETCAEGRDRATVCQLKLQAALDEASDPESTIESGLRIFCCNLAYATDCMVETAIPLCADAQERSELTQATNDFFYETPLQLFGRSCAGHEFWKRKAPKKCEGSISDSDFNGTYYEESEKGVNILYIVIPIAVVLMVGVAIGLYVEFKNKFFVRKESAGTASTAQINQL